MSTLSRGAIRAGGATLLKIFFDYDQRGYTAGWTKPCVEREVDMRTHLLHELRQAGYRLTAARRTIIDVFLGAREPLSPTEVYARARELNPRVGLVTVYRTLEALLDLGVVERIHGAGGCQGYVLVGSGHKHLAVCRACGQTLVFEEGDILKCMEERLRQETGFLVENHLLQFSGLCARCQNGQPQQAGTAS